MMIEDAQYALSLEKGSKLIAKNSYFFNNNFAIRTEAAGSGNYNITLQSNRYGTDESGLKPAYSGQSPAPLDKGFAGVYVKDIAGGILFDANPESNDPHLFFNLKYGIIAQNTELRVRSAVFRDILNVPKGSGYTAYTLTPTGRAIYSDKGLAAIIPGDGQQVVFDNCHTGVETSGTSSWVWRTAMTGMTNGIVTTNGLAIHVDNAIAASNRGIELRYLPPLGFSMPAYPVTTFGGVYGNTITISGNPNGKGVGVAGVSTPVDPSGQTGPPVFMGGNINGNTIAVNDGAAAVNILDAYQTTAVRNIISLGSGQGARRGIYMGVSDRNTLSCNRISGAGGAGIYAIHPSRGSVLCNLADGTGEGLHFEGIMIGKGKADIGGNLMKDNASGLLYGVDAITGEQVHRGNRWEGGNTLAQHLGIPDVATQSKYTVDVGENADFLPDSWDPFDWFEDISTPEETYGCSTPGFCISAGVSSGIFSELTLDEKIARGELPGSDYQAANNWLAQRRLYERLTEEGNPYPNNTDINNFLTAAQSNGIADYANLQIGIRQLFAVSQNNRDSFQLYETQITNGLDSLAAIEQQLHAPGISEQDSINLAAQREAVRQTIRQTSDAKNALLDSIATARAAAASTLLPQNNNLSASSPYSTHEKAVNDVLLRTIARGVFTFSEQDSTTLKDIAALCPLSDGEAVLRARALLTLVEETPETYDDEDICNSERGQSSQRPMSDFLRVFPNPADNNITIEYRFSDAQGGNFLLWNTLGQLVKTVGLSDNSGRIDIDLEGLNDGIYWYAFLGIKNLPIAGKILISH